MLLSLPLLIDQLSHLHEIGNDDDLVSALTDLSVVIDNNSLCSPDSEEEVKVEFANYVKERMDCDGLSAYLQSIELHREFLQQSHNKTVMDLGLEISDNGNDDSDSNQSGEFLGDQLFHFLGREKEGEEDTISEVEMLIPITVVKAKVDNFIVQQPIPRHHFPIMEFVNSNDLSDELSLARQQDDYTLRAPLPFYGEPRVSYSHRKSQIFSSAKLLGQTTKLPTEDIVSAMKDFHKNVKGYTHNNYFPTYGSGDNDTKNSMLRVNIAKGLGENSVNHPSFSFADFVVIILYLYYYFILNNCC